MNYIEMMNVVRLGDEVVERRVNGEIHRYLYRRTRKAKTPVLQELGLKNNASYITSYPMDAWAFSEYEIASKRFVVRHKYLRGAPFPAFDSCGYLGCLDDGTVSKVKFCLFADEIVPDGWRIRYSSQQIEELKRLLPMRDFEIIEVSDEA